MFKDVLVVYAMGCIITIPVNLFVIIHFAITDKSVIRTLINIPMTIIFSFVFRVAVVFISTGMFIVCSILLPCIYFAFNDIVDFICAMAIIPALGSACLVSGSSIDWYFDKRTPLWCYLCSKDLKYHVKHFLDIF